MQWSNANSVCTDLIKDEIRAGRKVASFTQTWQQAVTYQNSKYSQHQTLTINYLMLSVMPFTTSYNTHTC